MHERTAEVANNDPARVPTRRTRVRWLIAGLLAVGLIIAFIDRSNLSVAMPTIGEELGISPWMQTALLSAWAWTYAIFQLPAGWIADKLGPRTVYAAAVVWWSACTAAVALVRGVGSLFGLRLLLGIGEAPVMPSSSKAVSEWFPKREQARASGLYGAGSEAGAAIAVPLVALIIVGVGWRGAFVVTGALGILWAAAWLWIYRSPREHRWASQAEVDHITSDEEDEDDSESTPRGRSLPWAHLFRHGTIWGMFFGYIGRNFLNYFFITWYPTYLVQAQGFSTMDMAKYGAIPGLVAILGNFGGGWFSDHLVQRGTSLSMARKIPILIGTLGAGTVAFSAFASNAATALALLSVAFASASFASAAIFTLPIDVAPGSGNVSSIFAIQNTGSQIGGLLSPIVVGFLWAATGSFVVPLVLMGAVCLATAVVYAFVVKVEPLGTGSRPTTAADAAL